VERCCPKRLILLLAAVILGFALIAQAQVAYTVTYKYDNLHRLIEVRYSNNVVIKYTYDAVGNRTLKEVIAPSAKKRGQLTSE
jgi:YD repeat-containing protein